MSSESESDPELDVSRYDMEDDLNRYGSPVYKKRESSTAAPAVNQFKYGPNKIERK